MPDDRPPTEPMPVTDWLMQLAEVHGLPRGVSAEEQAALLDIARVAAHTSQRVAAPLTTYLAGLACAELPAAERGPALRALAEKLEAG